MFKHSVSIRRQLQRLGYDPVEVLVQVARATQDDDLRRKICENLLTYCHAKPSRNVTAVAKKKGKQAAQAVQDDFTVDQLLQVVKGSNLPS